MKEKNEILKSKITIDEETNTGGLRKNFDLVNKYSLPGIIVKFMEYLSKSYPKEFMQAISRLRQIQRDKKKSG